MGLRPATRREFISLCCGCAPIENNFLFKNINNLETQKDKKNKWRRFYNNKLKKEYKILFDLFNEEIFIEAPSFRFVNQWRLQQESKNISQSIGHKKMTINEIKIFTQYYEKITKWMMQNNPKKANLVIKVDKDQKIISLKRN